MYKVPAVCIFSLLLATTVQAQLKAKHFWPATTGFSIKKFHLNYKKSEGDISNQFRINECIEGNCDNGTGTWAVTYARKIDFRSNSYVDLFVKLFKGTFSDNGKKFNGKMLECTYTLDGTGAKNQDFYADEFTPKKIINLADDMAKPVYESNYVVAEGEAVFDSSEYYNNDGKFIYIRKYLLHGTGASREAMLKTGAATLQGNYDKGKLTTLHAVMKDNYPAKSFTGRMDARSNILAGRLEYKDGTVYEGFFREDNYYGPGRLTSSSGKVLQGYWEKGRLRDSAAFRLPAALWSMAGNPEAGMKETKADLFGVATTGKYVGDTKNNMPDGMGFFMTDINTWYAGGFTGGAPAGAGYCYQFKQEADESSSLYQGITVYTGLFAKGYLADGLIRYDRYSQARYPGDPNFGRGYLAHESTIQQGSFLKNKLQGCGEYRHLDLRWASSTVIYTGNFENGRLRGWGTVEQPGINTAGKLRKFTGFFPEKPLLGFMGERTDLLGFELSGNISGSPSYNFNEYIKNYSDAVTNLKSELANAGLRLQSCPSLNITEKEKQDYLATANARLEVMENILASNKKSGPPKVFTKAECDANLAGLKFDRNAVIKDKLTGIEFIVLDYFCQSKTYTLYPYDNFINNFRSGYSNGVDQMKSVEFATANNNCSRIGYFTLCSTCNGSGQVETWVSGGNKGGWEKWTDNVFYYRPSTAYSYKTKAACGDCNGKGWWVR